MIKLREWHDKKSVPESGDWYGLIEESVETVEAKLKEGGEWQVEFVGPAVQLEQDVQAAMEKMLVSGKDFVDVQRGRGR